MSATRLYSCPVLQRDALIFAASKGLGPGDIQGRMVVGWLIGTYSGVWDDLGACRNTGTTQQFVICAIVSILLSYLCDRILVGSYLVRGHVLWVGRGFVCR